MNFQTTNKAIRDFIVSKSEWSIPIRYENMTSVEPDSGIWAKYVFIPSGSEDASIGSPGKNVVRSSGIFMISLFNDFGKGDGDLIEKADAIITDLRSAVLSGIRLRQAYMTRVGRAGKWWQVNVTCPWSSDVLA